MASKTVFISYTSRDSVANTLAQRIHEELAAQEVCSFYDLPGIQPGDSILEAINSALPQVDAVIMVVSESSASSRWMMAECLWAFDHEKRVIPVLAEPKVGVPVPFNTFKRLDLATDFDTEWPTLLDLLGATAPTAPAKGVTAPTEPATHPDGASIVQLRLGVMSTLWLDMLLCVRLSALTYQPVADLVL
jgi:hypothetical protein